MPATDWQPTIGDEVRHTSTGRVGRMTLRNNAVHDEIAVRWPGGTETWERLSNLVPFST